MIENTKSPRWCLIWLNVWITNIDDHVYLVVDSFTDRNTFPLSSFGFNKVLVIHVLVSLMQFTISDMALCIETESFSITYV